MAWFKKASRPKIIIMITPPPSGAVFYSFLVIRREFAKLLPIAIIVVFLALFSGGEVQARISDNQVGTPAQKTLPVAQLQKDTLVVGSEQDYPPFATGMTDATAGGFTVDLWKAVAAEAGLNYTIRVLPFREVLQEFKEGKIDVLINLALSEERHRFADFTVPHVIVHGAIFVRKDETRIQSEDDLTGKSIIVLNADLAHDYAVSKGWEKQLVLVDNAAEGMRLLASGKHDAMLLGKLAGIQTLQALGVSNVEALKVKAGFSQKFAFAVPEGQSELLGKINEGLALAKSNGTYNRLYDKWFGIYEVKEVGLRDVLKYLMPVFAIFSGIAGYFLYRRQVERNKNEIALKESESRFRLMADSAPVFIWIANQDKVSTWFNKTALEFMGRSLEHVIGKGWADEIHPDDLSGCFENFVTHFDRREAFTNEFRLKRHDGKYRWILDSGVPRVDEDGNFVGYIGSAIDINDRVEAEERLLTLYTAIEQSPISVVIADVDANIEYVNPRFTEATGYTTQEAIGLNPRILQSGLTPKETYLELWQKVTNGQVWHGELINKRKNGEIYWEEAHISPVKNEAGVVTHYVAAKVDITPRKRNEEAIRQSEERFRFMLENSPIAVRISNMATCQVVFANQRYAELIGSVPAKVIGINPKQYYANPQDYADVIEQLGKGGRVTNKLVELQIPGAHAKTKWALASYLQLEYLSEPSVLGWFYDISDRKAMEEQVQHLAHYDALTDLPNRTLFADRLQQALAVAKRDKASLALMFIDLDKFKPINDTLGHHVGDLLLKEVAQRIQACLRESDTVARVGGDEFIVLLPTLEAEQDALIVAEKIRCSLKEPFELEGHRLGISSSTGVAIYPEHGSDEKQLVKNADTAMYYAKAEGRDNVKIYQSNMQEISA